MHLTIINLLGASSPFILIATLWGIWKESQTRSLMLRMLPPERRPVVHAPPPFWVQRTAAASADRKRHSRPLWTLQDCQIELLTEATMHAFEANATAYIPDRIAANYPPSLHRADADHSNPASILLRTLERTADMLSADAAAKYYEKPEIDESSADAVLSYIDSLHPVRIQKAA
jgi:hypothetical protein